MDTFSGLECVPASLFCMLRMCFCLVLNSLAPGGSSGGREKLPSHNQPRKYSISLTKFRLDWSPFPVHRAVGEQ